MVSDRTMVSCCNLRRRSSHGLYITDILQYRHDAHIIFTATTTIQASSATLRTLCKTVKAEFAELPNELIMLILQKAAPPHPGGMTCYTKWRAINARMFILAEGALLLYYWHFLHVSVNEVLDKEIEVFLGAATLDRKLYSRVRHVEVPVIAQPGVTMRIAIERSKRAMDQLGNVRSIKLEVGITRFRADIATDWEGINSRIRDMLREHGLRTGRSLETCVSVV